MPAAFDPARALRVLIEHDVRFVVVGGFAAWMHGAPIVTADLDILFDADPDNAHRLAQALDAIGATYRDPMGRSIPPTAAALASLGGGGHHLFTTCAGDLDALRESSGICYDDLASVAVCMTIDELEVPFARLVDVIEMKTRAGRPKDLAALPTLRAALEDDA